MRCVLFALILTVPAVAGEIAERVDDGDRIHQQLSEVVRHTRDGDLDRANASLDTALESLRARAQRARQQPLPPPLRTLLDQRLSFVHNLQDRLRGCEYLAEQIEALRRAQTEYPDDPTIERQLQSTLRDRADLLRTLADDHAAFRVQDRFQLLTALSEVPTEDDADHRARVGLIRTLERELDVARVERDELYARLLRAEDHELENARRFDMERRRLFDELDALRDELVQMHRDTNLQFARYEHQLHQREHEADLLRRDLFVPPLPGPTPLPDALATLPHVPWSWETPPSSDLPSVTWSGGRLADALDGWCVSTHTAWELRDGSLHLRQPPQHSTPDGLTLLDLGPDPSDHGRSDGTALSIRTRRWDADGVPLGAEGPTRYVVGSDALPGVDAALRALGSNLQRIVFPDGSALEVDVLGRDWRHGDLDTASRAVWQQVEHLTLEVEFSQTPLSQVVGFLQDLTAINMVLTPGLHDLLVDLGPKQTSLAEIADELCAAHDLTATWWCDALVFHPSGAQLPERATIPSDPETLLPCDLGQRLRSLRISVNFDRTPLTEALTFISDLTGISSYLPHPTDAPDLSLRLHDIPLLSVLELFGALTDTRWSLDPRIPAVLFGVAPDDLPPLTPEADLPAWLIVAELNHSDGSLIDALRNALTHDGEAPSIHVAEGLDEESGWDLRGVSGGRALDLWCWERSARWIAGEWALELHPRE